MKFAVVILIWILKDGRLAINNLLLDILNLAF